MCERLSDLRAAMQSFAAQFDSALISPGDAGMVVADAAAIENMAGVVKALAAARMAEGNGWRRAGDRSPAHHLARTTGTSVGQAAATIETAQHLGSLPIAARAARAGKLSSQQTSAIAGAAITAPDTEQSLVELAGRASLSDLRDECARIKQAAQPDPETRRRAIHDRRYLRTWPGNEGGAHLHVFDNPEVVAGIMTALGPIRDELFEAARVEGRREPLKAYAADALAELARRSLHVAEASEAGGEQPKTKRRKRGAAGVKLIARVDLPTLLRGYPIDGEVCELVGYGPVAVSALRDMIDSDDPFLAAVVTNGQQLLGVAHLGRRATARQQTALEWLYPKCANEACPNLAFLQNDHRIDWSQTHITLIDWLDRLCTHDHHLKTRENWSLIDGHGRRAFVPPNDPRHPKNTAAQPHAPPEAA